MAIGVDVLQANGVRMRRDVDGESRVVLAFEAPFGNPEEQRDVIRLVVRYPAASALTPLLPNALFNDARQHVW